MPGVNYETERGVLCWCCLLLFHDFFNLQLFSCCCIFSVGDGVMESFVHMNCHFILEGSMFYSSTQLENGWLLGAGREGVIKKLGYRRSGECHFSYISKNLKLFFKQFNAIFDHPGILSNWWGNSNFGPCGRRPIVGNFFFQNYFIFISKPSLTGRYSG